MEDQYQQEREQFRRRFAFLRNVPLAIYGIGRRTATLLPAIRDFRIVALLDRSPENLGKEIDGIPIRSLAEVNELADAIIINSDPGNYRVIYARIADDATIPVYFANGERAERQQAAYEENPYWDTTPQMLQDAIDAHDVISFDFFDTLVTRKAMTPTNLFAVLGERARRELHLAVDVPSLRRRAAAACPAFADLDAIYEALSDIGGIPLATARAIERMECDVEASLDVVRTRVADAFYRAVRMGKTVLIVSDTYYSRTQFSRILEAHGLDVLPADRLLLSSEMHKSKFEGDVYAEMKRRYPQARILHIGDHPRSDIEQAEAHGIDAFYLMNPSDMMKSSAIGGAASGAAEEGDDVRLGLVAARLFHDPFALHAARGKIAFRNAETFGYAVFGGVLLRFCEWLAAKVQAHHLHTLLFFARDGYFLERDFLHYLRLRGTQLGVRTAVVPISRQLIYLATMHTEEDFHRVATFAFMGTFRAYLFHRFHLCVDATDAHAEEQVRASQNGETLLAWLAPYESRIWAEQKRQERNYRKLLKETLGTIEAPAGIVDFSFYGTTQHYFQRFMEQAFHGFYFIADLTDGNAYRETNLMEACFNEADDPGAERSLVRKRGNFLESFLTAPYGMIRFIDDDGSIVTEPDGANQRHFAVKERVNDGVCAYMADAVALLPMDARRGADGIEAAVYHALLDGGAQVAPEILQGFYFDNDMVGTKEVPLEV